MLVIMCPPMCSQISSPVISAGKKVGQEFFGIDDRVKALVAHPDVEMLSGGRFDHMVVKLDVDRRTGILVRRLEAVHGRFVPVDQF